MTSTTINNPKDDGSNEADSPAPESRPLRETIYTPESPIRHPFLLVAAIFVDIWRGRELAWRLLVRNVSAQYRQTIFGVMWAFLPPIANTALWTVLNMTAVVKLHVPGELPYFVFLAASTVFWQSFVDAICAPLLAATQSKPMLAKVRFPREAIVVAAVGEVIFNFLIRFAVLIVFLAFFLPGGFPLGALWAPFAAMALILMGTAIGIWLAPIGLLYEDIARALPLVTQFWMLVTPVIYPAVFTWPFMLLIWLNPPGAALDASRDLLLFGVTDSLLPLAIMTGLSLVWLFFGLIFYRLSMPILIERMSA